MKKNNRKVKSLKRYKEELDDYLLAQDIPNAIKCLDSIIKDYPKNIFGYNKKIEVITNSYSKYLKQDELKELKELNDIRIGLASKKNKVIIAKEFDEYLSDINEVSNLEKTDKELVTQYLKKSIITDKISYLNNISSNLDTYRIDGKKILDYYDLLKGIFLVLCLVYNLIYRNALLIITVPFGIYGLCIIYSFITTNLSKNMFLKRKEERYKNISSLVNAKKEELNLLMNKIDEGISFNQEKKKSIILRLPKMFQEDLQDLYTDGEKNIAFEIKKTYISNDALLLGDELEANTNISLDEFNSFIDEINKYDDKISSHIANKSVEKKGNQIKLLTMLEVKKWNIVLLVILLLISILVLIVIAFNFYDFNFKSFIIALLIGIVSMLIYNINKGKSTSLIDTFNDNLVTTVFNASLSYNLLYASITNDIKFIYNIIEVPIVFTLILMGFVMLISYLKYNNYKKRLRK